MIDDIRFLMPFWELRADCNMLGEPLAAGDERELLRQMRRETERVRQQECGAGRPHANTVSARLIAVHGMHVEVCYVCPAGLLVVSAQSMLPGERVTLHIADTMCGLEYFLPCSVARAYARKPVILALAIDGKPRRSEAEPLEGGVRSEAAAAAE